MKSNAISNQSSLYIPLDRRHALAHGQPLPRHTSGSALFVDISGFTPLTEALAYALGSTRGAEELTIYLNRVYDALINELHRYGGSVIGFSGDAITCWLDGDDGHRATASAFAMRTAMIQFAELPVGSDRVVTLAIKAAVATGSVVRFVVGDPAYRLFDTMAGATLERLVMGEQIAERGDVILDEATVNNLNTALEISWRIHPESGLRFAVVNAFSATPPEVNWPELAENKLTHKMLSSWLLPPIHARLERGLGDFLAELRPAFCLFLRFNGIDYNNDSAAPDKLNHFIREAQAILIRLDGSLIQLTIGDKGSYLYIAFGAPIAHEDDGIRIVTTAWELHLLAEQLSFLDPVQIGVTWGQTRTGAYGSHTRRTYGVLGDAVNLSARLMLVARPGEILVSREVQQATSDHFVWENLPAIRVKGKRDPVNLARLVGLKEGNRHGLLAQHYRLPMIGRKSELALIQEHLTAIQQGQGRIIGLNAEAGMGKSRLTAEVIQSAEKAGVHVLGGECLSYATTTPYQVWQGIWRGFFELDTTQSPEAQLVALEAYLRRIDPTLLPRLPLLSPLLNLFIPDNELTGSLSPKVRRSSLEDLLASCLEMRCRTQSLLVVLEDCHWLDEMSRDLILEIGRNTTNLPILILLVYRPSKSLTAVKRLPHFSEITLSQFSDDEAQHLIKLKLTDLFGANVTVPPTIRQRVTEQAVGNPFYIEELVNYLHDLAIDIHDATLLQSIDLPSSISSLVLSRIDKLSESQQLTIKIASVIGRLFQATMLQGAYPDLPLEQVQQNLDLLSDLELTPLDTPEPELTYLFKHIITQQVAYESLLYATRARLHEQIGTYIEQTYADNLAQYTNLLAFHFEHSTNQAKKRHYLLKAGDAAHKTYANHAAITYFEKALPLLDGREQIDTQRKLGTALELTGSWDEAGIHYETALARAQALVDQDAVAWCQTALGELCRKRNDYETAVDWFAQAQAKFEALGSKAGLGQVLHFAGTLASQQGEKDVAHQRYQASLTLRQELGDRVNEANLLSNLGIIARDLGDNDLARQHYQDSLALREEIDHIWGIAVSLNNLGQLEMEAENYTAAKRQLERALVIWREIGERWATTNTLHNLANVARETNDWAEAQRLYAESIRRWQQLADNWGIAYWLEDCALLYSRLENPKKVIQLLGVADDLREQINVPRPPAYQARLEQQTASAIAGLGEREQRVLGTQTLSLKEAIALALVSVQK